ncbi:MAG: nicotinate-nucleotide adenylyltransferase [Lachnospiraceae bacterium]|nr:nicotinate-nucleotide adenylyltransferase [Lachnospiraceae bacterium]
MKKIGIMGGTFSPIHIGHLMIAQRAYEEYDLDQIIFLPNGNPPHKADADVLDASHRSEMVKLAIKSQPRFVFSDFEIKNDTFSYTSDTLAHFCDQDRSASYYFIAGADSLDYMDKWHEPQEIFSRATILAAPRGNLDQTKMEEKILELEERFHASIKLLHLPNVAISSNWIRSNIRRGYSIHYYVPDEVEAYIKENNLYQI